MNWALLFTENGVATSEQGSLPLPPGIEVLPIKFGQRFVSTSTFNDRPFSRRLYSMENQPILSLIKGAL